MKRGGPSHPKTFALAEALGIRRPYAIGLLELLFHFTAQYAPEGDIGRYPDKRIAAALDWHAAPSKLIDALVTAGWVDRHSGARLVVHDWSTHADRAVLQRLTRAGKKPIQSDQADNADLCTQNKTTREQKNGLPVPVPVPVPVPEPSIPTAAETAAAQPEDEDPFRVAEETFDLSDEERAQAWNEANGKHANGANGTANGTAKNSLLNPETETVLDQVARRIHERHPAVRRCGIGEAKKLLRAIARRAPAAKRIELLHQIDQNHVAWCKTFDWQKDGGQYAKGLDNWLAPTKERWSEAPASTPGGGDDRDENGYPRLMM